jgi:hypothetical protein
MIELGASETIENVPKRQSCGDDIFLVYLEVIYNVLDHHK